MKKLLFIVAAFLFTSPLFAQTGTIKITNNNAVCTAYVVVYGEDLTWGNNACDIVFGTNPGIILPPGSSTSVVPISWFTFGAAYGWSSTNPQPTSSTTFQFTDVQYQWGCPTGCGLMLPPTVYSGFMSDLFAFSNCYSGGPNYTGAGCTAGTSVWNNTTGTGIMDDILINLN